MYYKAVKDGYIVSVGIGQCAVTIDADEHERIKTAIATKPEAPDGYCYHLKEDLTWELCELPKEEPEPLNETEQKAKAYDILMGVTE